MTEQDAEAAELTNLMKKCGPSNQTPLGKTASQAADSIISQISDLASDSKVSSIFFVRYENYIRLY
jgi:hypothetical protein